MAETRDIEEAGAIQSAVTRAISDALRDRNGDCSDVEAFDIRGKLYQLALEHWPHARDEERLALLNRLKLRSGERGLEIAAGSGFLSRWILERTRHLLYALDPSIVQLRKAAAIGPGIVPLCISPDDPNIRLLVRECSLDFVTSVGGLHHVDEHAALFSHVAALLRPGGRFVAADVERGSCLANHFDRTVSRHSITGHHGNWLGPGSVKQLAAQAGMRVRSMRSIAPAWHFSNPRDMVLFFIALHGLDCHPDIVEQDLRRELTVIDSSTGVSVTWPLLLFEMIKPL